VLGDLACAPDIPAGNLPGRVDDIARFVENPEATAGLVDDVARFDLVNSMGRARSPGAIITSVAMAHPFVLKSCCQRASLAIGRSQGHQ